jgi:predicted 3-demethylubiquinone-9 3-methyltransferase (glyoxalase superfamily)
MDIKNQIYACLWSDGKAKEMAEFYCSVFKNSKIITSNSLVVQFEINDTKFMTLNGSKYSFTPASSYVIECDSQEEIDHYWNQLGEGGVYNKCGWLDDKFGVSWQVVPKILGKLMSDPEKSLRVMQAFLQMKKFDIQALLDA